MTAMEAVATAARPLGRQLVHRECGWAPGLEFRQLRALVALVDHGSMSAAARALGVAQSTVSDVVAGLERALGTGLVRRRRGSHVLALTPAGEALLPHARSALTALRDGQAAIAAVDLAVRDSVDVIASDGVGTYLLPPVLAGLRRQWPHLRFAVAAAPSAMIPESLLLDYDLGLVLRPGGATVTPIALGASAPATAGSTQSPRSLALRDVPLVVFSTAGHTLAARAKRTPLAREELAGYTLFLDSGRGPTFDMIHHFFRGDGVPGPRLEPAGSVEAVKQSVASYPEGLGVLTAFSVAEELRTGRLHALPVWPEMPRLRLEALLCRARSAAHPAVAAVLAALRDHGCVSARRSHAPSTRPASASPRPVPPADD